MQKKFKIMWIMIPLLLSACDISIIETPPRLTSNQQPSTSSSNVPPSTSLTPSTTSPMPDTSTSVITPSTSSTEITDWKDVYYYNNSYTSIYDIVQSWEQNHLIEGNVKTWGIVSKIFNNINGNQCFYIQSENVNHEHSAILVSDYNGSKDIQEGNVVSLEGLMKYDANTLTLTECQNLQIDYMVSPDSLLPLELTKEYLTATSFQSMKKQGHRYVSLSHVSIQYQSKNYIFANIDTESIEIVIENTIEASKIHSILSQTTENNPMNLWGVLKYGTLESSSLQLAISTAEDIENPVQNASQIVLNDNVSSKTSNRYPTGNYGYFSYGGYAFDYYRTAYDNYNSYFLKLLSLSYRSALGGMFSNYDAIPNILSLEVSYSLEEKGNKNPRLYFGSNNQLHEYKELNQVTSTTKFSIDFDEKDNIQYFRLESGDRVLYLDSVTIWYSNKDTANERSYGSSGEGLYRNNPSYYTGDLKEGTSFKLPIETERVGNSYKVISEKTYYYYSYDYIENHPEYIELATYTDPVDVANYFNAFHTYPANYVSKSEFSNAKKIFGEDARQWSYYDLTNGYATTVPYRTGDNGKPRYYELDIDLDGSYSSSRGVGRLVVWLDGWDVDGYDDNPVTVFTDDHYATFQEYYNNGLFSYRFNAIVSSRRSNYTNYYWGAPSTLA